MYEENVNNLRIIKTARDLISINKGAKEGYTIIMKELLPSKELDQTIIIYQHRITNKVIICPPMGIGSGGIYNNIDSEEYQILNKISYYPYKFKNPFAAYLIPEDIRLLEKVFVVDLIEDYIGSTHMFAERLDSCEAIWDGEKLKILYDEKNINHIVG